MLPFLSHVLRRLAEERTEKGELTFAAYETKLCGSGGDLRRALAAYAEEVFQSLPVESQATLPDVWPMLVTLGGEDSAQALRQYPRVSELSRNPAIASLIKRFVEARLFTASGDPEGDGALITVAHETLLSTWERARDWIEQNRQFLQIRANVERYQGLWEKSAPTDLKCRDRSLLLPPGLAIKQARELMRNHGSVSIDNVRQYVNISLRRAFWKRVRGASLLMTVAGIAMFLGIGGLLLYFMGSPIFSGEEKALEKFHQEVYELETVLPDEPPPLKNPTQAARPFHSYENRLGMEMIWCWPGTFEMGSLIREPARNEDETRHEVILTRGFWPARHEVTQGQWQKIMVKNSNQFRQNEGLPVEGVSWHGAMIFSNELTKLERDRGSIPEDLEYTLPTEAQWEYACRAGNSAPFSGVNLESIGWFFWNASFHTHPVGSKQQNLWGFHDMHGNVWDWCRDWYCEYPSGPVSDPSGPDNGSAKVDRGGGWFGFAWFCRSAARDRFPPNSNYFNMIGFRPILQKNVNIGQERILKFSSPVGPSSS